jgi:large subunit ribosomal protein L24
MACHVRRGDEVMVIAGDHKGERGKVLRVDPDKGLLVVEGVNMVYRHVRPSRRNPQGGRLQKEAPIRISNVLPVDPKTTRGARVRFEVQRDAKGKVTSKRRVTVGGTVLSEVTKAGSA